MANHEILAEAGEIGFAGGVPAGASFAMVETTSSGDDSSSSLVVCARGIGKAYRLGGETAWVLRGVDFDVRPGECVFLCGPSGSGKSTLLSILGCLLTADEGEIQIVGRRLRSMTPEGLTATRRDLIGFVFQRFQLIRGLSAEDNVALPLGLQGVPTARARQEARRLLDRVGLSKHRDAMPNSMSPGQCQRVAIARAVISGPRLVLADEPTAALDSTAGSEAMQLLKELVADSGAAAVVVTHDPRILPFADRVCEIDNGRLVSNSSNSRGQVPS